VNVAIVEAPSPLGLRPTGVEQLAGALLQEGLAERLRARVAERVAPAPYSAERDRETGFLNPRAVAAYASELAAAIDRVARRDEFPLVLGGDCSILLGCLLALKRRGRYGLWFMDGHTDFYQPEANVNGEIASSELSLATGRGPDSLTCIDGHAPLVRDEDVVAFGFRDANESVAYGSQPLPPEMLSVDLAEIRRDGIDAAIMRASGHLSAVAQGFWVHFDADVLDDAIMPAVDYRTEGGLSWTEAESTLRAALRTGRCAGVDVTIFNPTLDADGSIRRAFVEMLSRALLK
jgi:arginase